MEYASDKTDLSPKLFFFLFESVISQTLSLPHISKCKRIFCAMRKSWLHFFECSPIRNLLGILVIMPARSTLYTCYYHKLDSKHIVLPTEILEDSEWGNWCLKILFPCRLEQATINRRRLRSVLSNQLSGSLFADGAACR